MGQRNISQIAWRGPVFALRVYTVAGSRPPPYSFKEIKAFAVAEVLACQAVVPLCGA